MAKVTGNTVLSGGELSMTDIAKQLGISVTTISRALNNSSLVKEETRARVLEAVNSQRQQFRLHKKQENINIGINIQGHSYFHLNSEYCSHMVSGIFLAGSHSNIRYQLLDMQKDIRSGENVLQFMVRNQLDGMIFVAPERGYDGYIEEIASANLPVVLISGKSDDPRVGWIYADNRDVSECVVRYLQNLGHKRIALVTPQANEKPHRDALEAYTEVMHERFGEDCELVHLKRLHCNIDSGVSCTLELLARDPRPTAIYYTNYSLSIGGVKACNQMGLSIPDDISIVTAADDSNSPDAIMPPLTHVHKSAFDYGFKAGQNICARLKQEADVIHEVAEPEFNIRASTGPAPSKK